jgi:hypothetical protein
MGMPICNVGGIIGMLRQDDTDPRTHTVMQERIKVEGKAGNLGDNVTVQKEGDGKISVTSNVATSKR